MENSDLILRKNIHRKNQKGINKNDTHPYGYHRKREILDFFQNNLETEQKNRIFILENCMMIGNEG